MLWYDIVLRLLLSVGIGVAIGFQREYTGHPAGIKTNAMVCIGAAIIALIQVQMSIDFPGTDISRIIAQVVSGIGFIGAGCIMRTGKSDEIIKGLTTASTLWVVAALGIAAGLGYYILCISAFFIVLAVLIIFGMIRSRQSKRNDNNEEKTIIEE